MSEPVLPGDASLRSTAEALDATDSLAHFRDQFYIDDDDVCYLDGNSLGRLPFGTVSAVGEFMNDEWGAEVVDGWSHWVDEAGSVGDVLSASALGTGPGQTLVCDTTSVNLYQLVGAAIRANSDRKTILVDSANFPTDRYIVQGLAEANGMKLVTLDNDGSGGAGATAITASDERITAKALEPFLTDDVAVITLQAVQYRSGARSEIKAINDLARSRGIYVVWDCAHAIGSIELDFDANGVDLAVGCTYKYGNAGPGSPAWLFVSKRIQSELRVPIQGWFAQEAQFEMGPFFEPADTIRRFQIASPSIIGIRGVQASYEMIERAGIRAIAHKAAVGTDMMVELFDAWLAPLGFTLMTPREAARRGGHITIGHPEAKRIAAALRKFSAVVPDYRTPNSIRLAIAPLPTSYTEVWDGFERIRDSVANKDYLKIEDNGSRVT